MKKYLLTAMLFLVGCSPIRGSNSIHLDTPEMMVTPSPGVAQASITPPHPTQTKTQTATSTPEPSPTIPWLALDSRVNVLDNFPGIWSPTANEILFFNCTEEKTQLLVASAPDFNPEIISENVMSCPGPASITWGTDGKHIYYGGPLPGENTAIEQPDLSDLWVIQPDGTGERRLNQEGLSHRWLEFRG